MRPAFAATSPWRHAATKAPVSRTTWFGGERQNDRLIVAHLRKGCAGRDRRAGIAPHRLQQHIGLAPDFGELFQHHEAVGCIGDDDRPLEQRRIRYPQYRILKMSNASRTTAGIVLDAPRVRPAPRAAFRRRRT